MAQNRDTGIALAARVRARAARMAIDRRRALALARVSRRLARRAKRLQDQLKPAAGGAARLPRERKRFAKGPYTAWEHVLDRVGNQEALRLLLGAGLFGRTLPAQAAVPDGDRILVLVPHQDDEGIGAAGTLLLSARAGKAVRIVYYTDGATGFGDLGPEEVARVRAAEARRAWRRVPGVALDFLGHPAGNPGLAPEAVGQLAAIVAEFDPDTVFVPTFLEEHFEHRLLNRWLLELDAERPLGPGVEVWGYQVTTRAPGNAVVDVTEVRRRKRRLNRAWRSQNASVDYAHLAMGQDIANGYYLKGGGALKSTRPHAEVFQRFAAPKYLSLCERFLALEESFAAAARPPDFLVVGLQKSGTYWLTALLDAHPQVRCFPSRPGHADGTGEAHFFDVLARMEDDFPAFRKSMSRKLDRWFGDLVPATEPRGEEERAALRAQLRDRFAEYCEDQRRRSGKPIVGEKTTETVHHLDAVESLFPGVKKVCILRDPRDRVVSFHHQEVRKGRREERPLGADDVDAYAERVRLDYEGVLGLEDPYLVLTYEELAGDPVPTVSRLLDFLGAYSSSDTALELIERASFARLSGREPGAEDAASHLRKGVVGDWTTALEPELARRLTEAVEEPTRRVEERLGIDLSAYRTVGEPQALRDGGRARPPVRARAGAPHR